MTVFQQGQCPPPAGQEAATRVDQPDACGTTPTKVALKPAVQAFRDVGAGITPGGPGAHSLIDAFTHIDTEFKEAARIDAKGGHAMPTARRQPITPATSRLGRTGEVNQDLHLQPHVASREKQRLMPERDRNLQVVA